MEKYLEDMKDRVQVSRHIIGTNQGRTVEKYLEDMKEGGPGWASHHWYEAGQNSGEISRGHEGGGPG